MLLHICIYLSDTSWELNLWQAVRFFKLVKFMASFDLLLLHMFHHDGAPWLASQPAVCLLSPFSLAPLIIEAICGCTDDKSTYTDRQRERKDRVAMLAIVAPLASSSIRVLATRTACHSRGIVIIYFTLARIANPFLSYSVYSAILRTFRKASFLLYQIVFIGALSLASGHATPP